MQNHSVISRDIMLERTRIGPTYFKKDLSLLRWLTFCVRWRLRFARWRTTSRSVEAARFTIRPCIALAPAERAAESCRPYYRRHSVHHPGGSGAISDRDTGPPGRRRSRSDGDQHRTRKGRPL